MTFELIISNRKLYIPPYRRFHASAKDAWTQGRLVIGKIPPGARAAHNIIVHGPDGREVLDNGRYA